MARGTSIVKKLTGVNFLPKRLLGLPADGEKAVTQIWLGELYGMADKVVEMVSEKDEIMTGLTGMFAYVDDDKEREIMKAGKFWPPSDMCNDLVNAVKKGGEIEFGLRVGVMRSTNKAGYSWIFKPLFEAAEADPLAALITKAHAPQVTHEKAEEKAEEKTEEKAETPKKKGKAA